jgi:hypothetical protein
MRRITAGEQQTQLKYELSNCGMATQQQLAL